MSQSPKTKRTDVVELKIESKQWPVVITIRDGKVSIGSLGVGGMRPELASRLANELSNAAEIARSQGGEAGR